MKNPVLMMLEVNTKFTPYYDYPGLNIQWHKGDDNLVCTFPYDSFTYSI